MVIYTGTNLHWIHVVLLNLICPISPTCVDITLFFIRFFLQGQLDSFVAFVVIVSFIITVAVAGSVLIIFQLLLNSPEQGSALWLPRQESPNQKDTVTDAVASIAAKWHISESTVRSKTVPMLQSAHNYFMLALLHRVVGKSQVGLSRTHSFYMIEEEPNWPLRQLGSSSIDMYRWTGQWHTQEARMDGWIHRLMNEQTNKDFIEAIIHID